MSGVNDPRVVRVLPNEFEPERHFYPRVLNAHIHPLVSFFFNLDNDRIAARYCHLHPNASLDGVRAVLAHVPTRFRWGGADLFHVADENGNRRMVVIETNSCPSGQKSMPVHSDADEMGGYRKLITQAFLPGLKKRGLPDGDLAVIYDKNEMECSGYAATIAELVGEPVWLVRYRGGETDPMARFDDNRVLTIKTPEGWRPIRACFRYVTQSPWNRIPPIAKTYIFNSVLTCLAGGRNKALAAKAYDLHNARIAPHGLRIEVPETIWDVGHAEIPIWVERMGGIAVIKNPYSNAGQGVYTITNEAELKQTLELEQRYDRFVVQQLIGNVHWRSVSERGALYHVGTVPNKKGQIFVADVRFMVGAGAKGFFPVAVYGRRARQNMTETAPTDSWSVLGTNLSYKTAHNEWSTETERLLLMDSRDFNRLGVGLDDLIDAYVQTVLAVTAIDEMCTRLVTRKGRFSRKLFLSMNPDEALLDEVLA